MKLLECIPSKIESGLPAVAAWMIRCEDGESAVAVATRIANKCKCIIVEARKLTGVYQREFWKQGRDGW
jgi:hypothetical protein